MTVTGLKLGAYSGPMNPSGSTAFEGLIHRPLDYSMDFIGYSSWSVFDSSVSQIFNQWNGRRLALSVPLTVVGTTLAQVNSGAFDAHFQQLASACAAYLPNIDHLRLGWEFNNGTAFPWNTQGTNSNNDYILAYQRVVSIFRAASIRFLFDFCFFWNSPDWQGAYPGDGFVDSVSIDLYDDVGGSVGGLSITTRWADYLAAPAAGNSDLNTLATFTSAHGKRAGISEYASNFADGSGATFVNNVFAWLLAHSQSDHHGWWNSSNAVVQATNAFFVSTTGNDANTGTIALPFLTLEAAQNAMRSSSSIRTTFIRAGTYSRTAPLTLVAQDSGTVWSFYSPDGVNSAVLDGGGTLGIAIEVGASNITINGIKIQNFNNVGIHHDPGPGAATITGITIKNCDIGNITGSTTNFGAGRGSSVLLENVSGVTISNNYFHDTARAGCQLFAYWTGSVLENVSITQNFCERNQTLDSLGSALYVSHHGGYVMTTGSITSNYVRNYGSSTAQRAAGIFLDDTANHWTVSNNVIGPPNAAALNGVLDCYGVFNNSGSNNSFTNNIIDVGGTAQVAAGNWFYSTTVGLVSGPNPPVGLVFQHNIVIMNFAGTTTFPEASSTLQEFMQNLSGSAATGFAISANMYKNYGSGSASTIGPLANDTNPTSADPLLSGWTYILAGGSPAFNSPTSFVDITRTWGPPGFVVPQVGVVPSCPH